jgi:hypothetical protein
VGESRSDDLAQDPGDRGSPNPPRLTRRKFLARVSRAAAGAMALTTVGLPAVAGPGRPLPASAFGPEVATAWFDLALDLVRRTAGFSPPVASRAFGYAGVTLYEAVFPGIPGYGSLAGQLTGLASTPAPSDPAHDWPTVANAALAWIFRGLFPTAPNESRAAMDSLEASFTERRGAAVAPGILRRSVARGRNVAAHIFQWSQTDGGHEAYLNNFPHYTPPAGPGLWVSTPPGFLPALQPYWGSNRPFAPASGGACDPGPPLPYSEERTSPFFEEARECYDQVSNLTPEQEAIARFWSDDPGLTSTPPGHSVSILTQVIRAGGLGLDLAAEAYAKVGIALADAFIACWRTKYWYNLLRPVTYIRRVIDPTWSSLLVTPPFPEYTSGHSVQAAASAQVLTDLFGTFAFTDHTHDDRGLAPRSFGSFYEAAEEAAISRLYGGIHFRAAIASGLEQGLCLGRGVGSLESRGVATAR